MVHLPLKLITLELRQLHNIEYWHITVFAKSDSEDCLITWRTVSPSSYHQHFANWKFLCELKVQYHSWVTFSTILKWLQKTVRPFSGLYHDKFGAEAKGSLYQHCGCDFCRVQSTRFEAVAFPRLSQIKSSHHNLKDLGNHGYNVATPCYKTTLKPGITCLKQFSYTYT